MGAANPPFPKKFVSTQPLYPSESKEAPPEGKDLGPSRPIDWAANPGWLGLDEERANPPTLEAIYEVWFTAVCQWVRALGAPEADREDLVQEVFVVVQRRLADFDGQNLKGWLYQIARGKVRDYRRLRWVRRVVLWDWEGNREADGAAPIDERTPLAILATNEKRRLLMKLLDSLNEAERTAIVLFEVDGYSGQEIAELQGVPLNTVWTRIHKARGRLSKKLLRLETQTNPSQARKSGVP